MILRKQTGGVKGTVVLALSLVAADEVRSWTAGGRHPFFDFEIPKEVSKEILGGEKGFLFGFPEVSSRGQVKELLNRFNRTLLEGTLSVLLRESGVSVRNVSSLADEIYHDILHGEVDGTVEVSETKEIRYSVDRPEGDLPVLVVELSVADKEQSVPGEETVETLMKALLKLLR